MTTSPGAMVDPNDFSGSDVDRINRAVQVAGEAGGLVVVPRVNRSGSGTRDFWLLDSAILLPSNITLELDQCRLKLSDRCRDNFIRSANCGLGIPDIAPLQNIHVVGRNGAVLEGSDRPRSTGDSGKTIGQRTYGTDAGVAGESQTGDWRNIGILLARVDGFSIEGLRMVDSHCWGISLEHCAHGRIANIDFASSGSKTIDGKQQTILNQDGVDLRVGCHDIEIESITGYSGDDLVALTAIPHYAATAGSLGSTHVTGASAWAGRCDDIANVTIRAIRGYCRGGHHVIRFLNTSGIRMHDVVLDGVDDLSPPDCPSFATVKIGDNCPAWGGITPLGDTYRFAIANIVSRSKTAILVGGSLADSTIRHVTWHGGSGDVVRLQSGPEYVWNVTIQDLRNPFVSANTTARA